MTLREKLTQLRKNVIKVIKQLYNASREELMLLYKNIVNYMKQLYAQN
jgi:hypothetical protein